MLGSIRQLLADVKNPDQLKAEFIEFEEGIEQFFAENKLNELLDRDIHCPEDEIDTEQHAAAVNAFRRRIARYHSIAKAAYRFAQGFSMVIQFTPERIEYADHTVRTFKVTREVREAWERELSGPWEGLALYLEETLKAIDHHVNLAKKIFDVNPSRGVSDRYRRNS